VTQTLTKIGLLCLAIAVGLGIALPADAGLETGLLNYWQFEGDLNDTAPLFPGTASTVADNGVFDGTNGTGGINFDVGLFGAGIAQDGAAGAAQDNGFVRVARSADTLRGGQSVSISAWVKAAGFDTDWQTILSHGEGSQYRIARRGGDIPPVASYAGGSGDIPTSGIGPALDDDAWHHIVAISENGVSTRIWVDGGLVETGAAPTITDNGNDGAPGGSTPDLFIGANPQTGANNREWWGSIDDVAIWDRPLDELDVTVLYQAGQSGVSLAGLIPEPSALSLCGLALLGLLGLRSKQR
jgi:hypothetical protein